MCSNISSLRSKRFRLVSKQRKTEERICGYWPREKWNKHHFSWSLTLVPRSLLRNHTETLCYAGYNIPSLISSLICVHSIIYLVFTVTLWLCFPSAESIYDPPRRTNFASFPWSLNSSDTHSHAFPNISYIPNNKRESVKHSIVWGSLKKAHETRPTVQYWHGII